MVSKKQRLWALYAQGYGMNSPEPKKIAPIYQTRWDCHKEWEVAGMPGRIGHEVEAVAKVDTPEVINDEMSDTAHDKADTAEEIADTSAKSADTAVEKSDTAEEKAEADKAFGSPNRYQSNTPVHLSGG